MEESLIFLKPDAVLRRGIGAAILQEFLRNENFSIVAFKEVIVSEDLAKNHYHEHEGKHFFPWLIKAVRAAPVLAMIVQGEIKKIREFLGATFVQKADPNTIRGKYGIWGGVNSVHASDGVESGLRELELWKKLAKLQKDPKALGKLQAYLKKWITYSKNNTLAMRALCKTLAETPTMKEQTYQQLIPLLKGDCPQADMPTIQNLANIIIENVLL
jgi:nucleoside-diphosphate kinase